MQGLRRVRLAAGLATLLFVFLPLGVRAASSQDARASLEKRVRDFYSLLRKGEWEQAEKYVTKETRENFRQRGKVTFRGFVLQEITLESGGQRATSRVVVTAQHSLPSPMAMHIPGAPVPNLAQVPNAPQISNLPQGPVEVDVAQTLTWVLQEGNWYAEVPAPVGGAEGLTRALKSKPEEPNPTAQELKFAGQGYYLGVMKPGATKTARFPFTNVSDQVVEITKIDTGCECIRPGEFKKQIQPGESGELAFHFDAGAWQRSYGQTIVVWTNPGARKIYLNLAAYIEPTPPRPPPQP